MVEAAPNGFVHVIESPSPIDLLDGRTEGRSLGQSFKLAGIEHAYSLAVNRQMVQLALTDRLESEMNRCRRFPIIHFSAHGNGEGLELTDGTMLSWADLSDLLQPIYRAVNSGLLICLSSCESASGMRMAMEDGTRRHFWALVSHMGKPTWSDCATAYIAFYNQFFKGCGLEASVEAMKAASGDNKFATWDGDEIKRGWLSRANIALFSTNDPVRLGGLGGLGGFAWPPK